MLKKASSIEKGLFCGEGACSAKVRRDSAMKKAIGAALAVVMTCAVIGVGWFVTASKRIEGVTIVTLSVTALPGSSTMRMGIT